MCKERTILCFFNVMYKKCAILCCNLTYLHKNASCVQFTCVLRWNNTNVFVVMLHSAENGTFAVASRHRIFHGIIPILFDSAGHKLDSDWFPTLTISSHASMVTYWWYRAMRYRGLVNSLWIMWLEVGSSVLFLQHEA